MDRRHKRAMIWVTIVAAMTVPPILYLASVLHDNALKNIKDLGSVSEFAYATLDGTDAFTNYDTFKRVSFLLQLPVKGCVPEEACGDAVAKFLEIKHWADDELYSKNPGDPKPQHLNFVIMTPVDLGIEEAGIKIILLDPETKHILPPETPELTAPVFTAISQESRFSANLGMDTPNLIETTKRLLASLTSEAYLFHYLTMQSLMWKRAKDYARGKLTTGE